MEGQIAEINKDEQSIEQNLEFISQCVESILITRKDSFKEQLTKYYKEKDDEVLSLKKQLQVMENNDRLFEAMRNELLRAETDNKSYKKQLNEIHSANTQKAHSLQSEVEKAREIIEINHNIHLQVLKDRDEAQQTIKTLKEELFSTKSEWVKASKDIKQQNQYIEQIEN